MMDNQPSQMSKIRRQDGGHEFLNWVSIASHAKCAVDRGAMIVSTNSEMAP